MENFVPHKQGDEYDNDEDRRMGYLIATRKCSAKHGHVIFATLLLEQEAELIT